jgi:RimJ/RimL family protein N-acetyltransferase
VDNAEPPVLNVVGDRVALGPIRRDLLPTYQRWVNDLAAGDRLGMLPRPMTLEAEVEWYDDDSKATDPIGFTIYERATPSAAESAPNQTTEQGWRPIGNCALFNVDHRHGTAEFVILIGEADARGKGNGTEAVRLLLDYAFTALGLHNVRLGVWEFNLAGRRAYEKAGFREFGRRRQSIMLGGRCWDEILMDCLATEFQSPVLASVFRPDPPKATAP